MHGAIFVHFVSICRVAIALHGWRVHRKCTEQFSCMWIQSTQLYGQAARAISTG